MIGLQRGIVKLVPHNPEWIEMFTQEKKNIDEIGSKHVVNIEHIGSTAIADLLAKPVIDIAVGIDDMSNVQEVKDVLEVHGWIWRPKFGDMQSHIVFAKGTEEVRTHYLHLMLYGGKIWNERIKFRDYLRTHESERKEYEGLKQKAMEEFGSDRKTYTAQKDDFVLKILNMGSEKNTSIVN